MSELDKLQFIPESGAKRMRPMVSGRSDWCISCLVAWGVPIPAFYHKDTNEVLMDEAIITHFTEIVRKRGCDAWWEMEVEELLPEEHKAVNGDYARGLHHGRVVRFWKLVGGRRANRADSRSRRTCTWRVATNTADGSSRAFSRASLPRVRARIRLF